MFSLSYQRFNNDGFLLNNIKPRPFKLRYYRINGLLNSMIGLRSWKRKK